MKASGLGGRELEGEPSAVGALEEEAQGRWGLGRRERDEGEGGLRRGQPPPFGEAGVIETEAGADEGDGMAIEQREGLIPECVGDRIAVMAARAPGGEGALDAGQIRSGR